jgi:hypothetical protein
MSVAALTPRVRIMAVCDEVAPSTTEPGVFTLEGVRQQASVGACPARCPVSVFLLLSNPRAGTHDGSILVVNEQDDKTVRYVHFGVTFQGPNEVLPLFVDFECTFPGPGPYSFQVWFSGPNGGAALKGEQPFYVLP